MSNIDVITGEVLDDMDKEVSEVVETIQSTEPEVKPKRTYNKKQVIDPIIPQETNQLIQGDVMEEVKVESPVETVAEVKVQDLVIEEVDEPEVDNSYADEEAPTENETFAAQIDTNALTEALKLKDVDVKVKSIPGTVPDLVSPPSGCAFHPRCPYAMEICKRQAPKPSYVKERVVECHLYS